MDPCGGKERKIFGAFMAANKVEDHHHHQIPNLQQHHQIQHMNNQMLPFGMMMQSASSSSTSLPPPNINKDGAYELSELDRALFQYLGVQDHPPQEQPQLNPGMTPHTLNIFPSEPMHVDPSQGNSGLAAASGSSQPTNDASASHKPTKLVKRAGKGKGPASSSEQGPKSSDAKTLRRLAQNREAARKSRLRKKVYVQNLECSKVKLIQLEQQVCRARSQGPLISGDPNLSAAMMDNINNTSAVAAWFDTEYNRWLEEHHRQTMELRRADLSENEVRMMLDNHLAHYDRLVELKNMMARSDVFHILSGIWKGPAERCLLWLGGFRPSHLIEMVSSQIEALTNQQVMEIYRLKQSAKDAEKAMLEGVEALNQSITETITADTLTIPPTMTTYTTQMAVAIENLSAHQGFIHQADNLRQQILVQLRQILRTRQCAQCFVAMDEYFYRLRTLSSLWLARNSNQQ